MFIVALLCLVLGSEATETDQTNIDNLIAVVQLFRHGERTPESPYPNDPYADRSNWPVAAGQLTNVGKQQHYALGTFTRRRYNGFLPTKYDPTVIRAQTTDVDRTHMSCQVNLAAIFPPDEEEMFVDELEWQPIPVHPIPKNVMTASPNCKIYHAEMAYLALKDPLFQVINSQFAETYSYMANYSGLSVNSLIGLSSLRDSLYIENGFNYTLPEWTKEIYPEPTEVLNGVSGSFYAYTTEMKRLMSGVWLNTVITYFEEMWKDSTSSPKYQMYSAHDLNIAAVLKTIGAYDDIWPDFASTIYLELRNISNSPVVNIWYKNREDFRAITAEGCTSDCPLNKFKSSLSAYLLDTDTWATECAATSTSLIDLLKAALSEDVVSEMARIRELLSKKTNW